MFNLFVSAGADAWNGDPWETDRFRCVNEYTDKEIIEDYGSFSEDDINELKLMPCIFAYETSNERNPKFGMIKDVTARKKRVRIEYEIIPIKPFITWEDIEQLRFELDISDWEMNRTHWAVKNVTLHKELWWSRRVSLPGWIIGAQKAVNLTTHTFDVSLSFPGEARQYVK
jgi:hypothetical protein